MGLFSKGSWKNLISLGPKPAILGLTFNTDGSGVPTIVSTNGQDYRGLITVGASTVGGANDFVVTVPGTYGICYAAVAISNKAATINITPAPDPALGTVELACSASLQSARVDVILLLSGATR